MTNYLDLCKGESVVFNTRDLIGAPILGITEDLRDAALLWQEEWSASQGLDTARD